MKKIRTIVENPFFIFMLLVVFVSSSFTQKMSIENQAKFKIKNLDSKELFKGIVFNNGKVSSLIPQLDAKAKSLEKFDIATIEKMRNLENSVMSAIEKENPIFFDEFKNAITSKNHSVIKEKLLESSKLVNDKISLYANLTEIEKKQLDKLIQEFENNKLSVVDENGNLDQTKLQKFENSLSAVRPPDVLLAIVLVAVAVAVYAWVYFWGKASSNNTNLANSNSLELDQIVNNIAKL